MYTYFTEFLQMDKRGEHLSWLCMFWMLGGLYASFTAWGIIPHYGDTQHLGSNISFYTHLRVLTHSFPTGLQVGASPSARSFRCTAGDYLSWCASSQLWLLLLEWSSCRRALVSSWRSDPVMLGQDTQNKKHTCFHAFSPAPKTLKSCSFTLNSIYWCKVYTLGCDWLKMLTRHLTAVQRQ